ncbi:hypothetical protein Salat_1482600 [Sesamum alatum]|uniref:Uncharacterized protein n=1 Tax=Sesamum alatum TaxID=300844 RepID=A0AAE1YBW1_9LAMI|nr:hypothetical protein Salat_1482600 [Sesamum alatum]
MQAGPVVSLSPSFNSYSNTKLAEIAARVAGEFDPDELYGEFCFDRRRNSAVQRVDGGGISENRVAEGEESEDEEEFEFAFVTRESEMLSPISADEIFHDGKIRPVYPVFNRGVLLGGVGFGNENEKENGVRDSVSSKGPRVRLPLRKLFIEERETTVTTSSSSSSEADELDGVAAETYCVWRPKEAAEEEDGRCKNSGSAGSTSKRWKLRDLLHRSHSEGSKDSFVTLSHSSSGTKKENEKGGKETPASGGKVKPAVPPPPPPPYNRDGGEKQRSYLPYRQDIVGIFGNVNVLSKNLKPF